MNTHPTGWKHSYWPEPRFGRRRQTRAEAIRANREAVKARAEAAAAKRITEALLED